MKQPKFGFKKDKKISEKRENPYPQWGVQWSEAAAAPSQRWQPLSLHVPVSLLLPTTMSWLHLLTKSWSLPLGSRQGPELPSEDL